MKFAFKLKLSTYRIMVKRGITCDRMRKKDFYKADFSGLDMRGDFADASFADASFAEAKKITGNLWDGLCKINELTSDYVKEMFGPRAIMHNGRYYTPDCQLVDDDYLQFTHIDSGSANMRRYKKLYGRDEFIHELRALCECDKVWPGPDALAACESIKTMNGPQRELAERILKGS